MKRTLIVLAAIVAMIFGIWPCVNAENRFMYKNEGIKITWNTPETCDKWFNMTYMTVETEPDVTDLSVRILFFGSLNRGRQPWSHTETIIRNQLDTAFQYVDIPITVVFPEEFDSGHLYCIVYIEYRDPRTLWDLKSEAIPYYVTFITDDYDLLDATQTALEHAETEIGALESAKRDLEIQVIQLTSDIADLRASLTTLETAYTGLSMNYSRLQDDYEDVTIRFEALSTTYEALVLQFEILGIDYATLTHNYEGLQSRYLTLQHENNALNGVKDENEELTSQIGEHKHNLAFKDDQILKGSIVSVAIVAIVAVAGIVLFRRKDTEAKHWKAKAITTTP